MVNTQKEDSISETAEERDMSFSFSQLVYQPMNNL